MKARAALVAALMLILGVALAPTASAHPSGDWYKKKWIQSEAGTNIDWFFVNDAFSPGSAFRDDVKDGADQWAAQTNGGRVANKVTNVDSVNYSPQYDCPNNREKNGVFYLTIDGVPSTGRNTLAQTIQCMDGDNATPKHMWTANIIFDAADNWSVSSTPGPNEIWVTAVASHEFGHFFGFTEHFDEPGNPNRDNSICYPAQTYADQQTMCRDTARGTNSIYQWYLETHDVHTFNNTY